MNAGQEALRLATRISDYFVPEQVGDDAEELRRRGQMVLVVVALGFISFSWTAAYQSLYGSWKFALVAMALLPIAPGTAFLMKSGLSISKLTNTFVILFYSISVGLWLATGGFWPGGLYSLAIAPAIALVLTGRKSGLGWTGITLGSIAFLSWYSGQSEAEPLITFSDAEIRAGGYRIAVMISLVIVSIAGFYSWLYQRTYESWRDVAETVRHAESRFRAISENAHDLIAELDGDGVIIYASPGYEEAIGLTPEEVVGYKILDVVHDDDLEQARIYWQELLEKGVVKQRPLRFETGGRGTRWLEVTMRSYLSPKGELRIVAVSRDVTERLEQEKRMRRQESLATMGTMAAGAAHQLSSPLTAMIASAQFAKIARDDRPIDPVVIEMLDRIENEATRCGQILRSMLSFASEERSERWIECIHPVIDRAVQSIRDQGDASGVEIVISRCPEMPMVHMSPIEIEQVLINLIRNSIQAGAGVVVVGTVVDSRGRLQITVSDDGSGITETSLAQVFEAFYSSHPGSGSGLGLAIAREIVNDHSGELRVLGSGGEGTMMRVDLPMARDEAKPLLQ